jgi:hypothetical protein
MDYCHISLIGCLQTSIVYVLIEIIVLVIKYFFTVLTIFYMVLTAPIWTLICFTQKKLNSWSFQESWCICVLAHCKYIWGVAWLWIHSRSCWLFVWSTLECWCSLSPDFAYIAYIWGLSQEPDVPVGFVRVHVAYICSLSERAGG